MLTKKLLDELAELLADYAHLAEDEGKIDPFRKRRIARIKKMLADSTRTQEKP